MESLSQIIISDIDEVLTVCANKGRQVDTQNRRCYGLSFCTSGKITYTHNGRQFVSEKGNAIILPKGATYRLYNNEGGEFPLINFSCAKDFTEEFITLPINSVESYLNDFERLKKYFISVGNRLRSIGILYDIFDRINREAKADGILTPAIKKIHSDFCSTDINNFSLAKTVNMSEIYFRRLFKEKYSTTPKQYILNMRINLAKQKLAQTNNSVNQISLDCGFSSVYHFCRAFKEKTGITPTEYRKNYN